MIEIEGLTKRYGDKTAVDRLSFVVEPGVVTGFLGPNGAGKSTTMRMIAGLDRPTAGRCGSTASATPGGRPDGGARHLAGRQLRPSRAVGPQQPAGAGADGRHGAAGWMR